MHLVLSLRYLILKVVSGDIMSPIWVKIINGQERNPIGIEVASTESVSTVIKIAHEKELIYIAVSKLQTQYNPNV